MLMRPPCAAVSPRAETSGVHPPSHARLHVPLHLAVAALAREADLSTISHVVITHMGPNRVPTLAGVLEKILAARGRAAPPLQLVVSNPLVKVLQSGMASERRAGLDGWARVIPRASGRLLVGEQEGHKAGTGTV